MQIFLIAIINIANTNIPPKINQLRLPNRLGNLGTSKVIKSSCFTETYSDLLI